MALLSRGRGWRGEAGKLLPPEHLDGARCHWISPSGKSPGNGCSSMWAGPRERQGRYARRAADFGVDHAEMACQGGGRLADGARSRADGG